MRNHRYVHGRGKDLEGGALAMDIQGIREGALFAMHNMQDVWSFLIYRVFLLAGMPACYIYRQQEGRQAELPKGRRDFKMKNVRELETYGAILIGCGIMAYTLMLASVDAPVWATIEFVMGTLFMVVGVWCVYLAGMEYDYQMEKRRYRNKR